MPRKPRVQYVGAVYHVMNRGDRREPIFKDEEDRGRFFGYARGGLMFPKSSALSAPSAAIVWRGDHAKHIPDGRGNWQPRLSQLPKRIGYAYRRRTILLLPSGICLACCRHPAGIMGRFVPEQCAG